MIGFEALVRWFHPDAGLIMPDRFIPLAESSGLIGELTEQIFDLGLSWLARHFPKSELRLSVNISAKNLGDLHLVDRVSCLARQHDIHPCRLIFEVTETSAMDDPMASLNLLTRFRVKGFHLSLDDFGTGYSSMVQLVRLPFTEIKVDRSFVMAAMQSQESRAIIKSIVDLSHSLGLQATAEGVEDGPTLDFLMEIDCDLAQGYFIARPMPGETVAGWIAEWDAAAKSKWSSRLQDPAPLRLAA